MVGECFCIFLPVSYFNFTFFFYEYKINIVIKKMNSCRVCLQSGEQARLVRWDLSTFFSLCAIEYRHLGDPVTWLCTFCWARVVQCERFIHAAKRVTCDLASILHYSGIESKPLFPYKNVQLEQTIICEKNECQHSVILPHCDKNNKIHIKTDKLSDDSSCDANYEQICNPSDSFDTTIETKINIKEEIVEVKLLPIEFADIVHEKTETVNDENRKYVNKNKRKADVPKDKKFKKYIVKKSLSKNKNEKEKLKLYGLQLVILNAEQQKEEIDNRRKSEAYTNSEFKCEECAQHFASEAHYKAHVIKFHDKSAGEVKCPICCYHFKRVGQLNRHKLDHARKGKCINCGTILCRTDWARHHYNCEEGPLQECDICHKKYKSVNRMMRHKLRSHKKKLTLKCDLCGKGFDYQFELKQHMQYHSGVKPYECHFCTKKFHTKGLIKLHLHTKHVPIKLLPEEPLEERYCVECDQYFKTKRALHIHLTNSRRHGDPESFKYECGICPKRFSVRFERDIHVKQWHYQSKDFQCSMCEKAFSVERYLQRHIQNTHEKGEVTRDHICDLCGAAFTGKGILRNHRVAVHERRRPHECQVCKATFGYQSALYTHNKLKHEGKKKVYRKPQPSTSQP